MNLPRSIFIPFFAFCLVILLSISCKEPEPFDPGDNQTNETKGDMTFKAVDGDGDPVSGVFIGITPSASDRDNGNFLRSGQTGSNGKVEFEVLEPLTYYYSAVLTNSGQTVTREGRDSVIVGEETVIDLSF